MKRTIYIFSNGELKRKQNTIYFEREKGDKKYVPVENTGEIMIFGEITINKKLFDFLSQQEIILHFFNYYYRLTLNIDFLSPLKIDPPG